MAGFGRREIEYMQALCIHNKYIEYYSVIIQFKEYVYSVEDGAGPKIEDDRFQILV